MKSTKALQSALFTFSIMVLVRISVVDFTLERSSLDLDATNLDIPSTNNSGRRRLSDTNSSRQKQNHWYQDVPHLYSFAKSTTSSPTPFRVLLIITSLSEYDKGTRGTLRGYDRLQNVLLPPLLDSVNSMTSRGWHVDVYLILGYTLLPERRQIIQNALPHNVGLEIWDDAIPLFYANSFNKRPKVDQSLTMADHALSRQHRFVLRDKLEHYDFFSCFEDDMRIMDTHVLNFLEMSNDIWEMHERALGSEDGMVRVDGGEEMSSKRVRHQPNDKATVGNDVVDDPISAEHIERLFPGLLRVEVLDRQPNHPLRAEGVLNNHRFVKEVPPSDSKSTLSSKKCCEENDPPRGKMTSHPSIEEVVMWETNIQATGVRRYPDPIGWAAAMP
jgi:hypothetical protein